MIADWLRLVRFSHTLFALPFALVAMLVASDGRPAPARVAWILVALVAARTAAMAYNRFVDRDVDARNPRTRGRELPQGRLSPRAVLALAIGASLLFVASAAMLGRLPGLLAPPVLAILLGYSHAKRFTVWSHFWLGLALGLAPPAAWIATTGGLTTGFGATLLLGAGVALWVAGFDLLYACQDEAFDRAAGLRSIPAWLGVPRALRLARICHALAVPAFAAFGECFRLGWPWRVAILLTVLLLVHEHRLVRGGDLRRIQAAFFAANAGVSITLLAGAAGALYL